MTKAECERTILNAMYSCARTCENTHNVDNALKMADAVDKLAHAYSYLKHIKEDEQ